MKKLNKGFSGIAILLVLGVLIVIASALSYYFLSGKVVSSLPSFSPPTATVTPQSTTSTTLEEDLKQIDEGSPDKDLKDLDSDAQSL